MTIVCSVYISISTKISVRNGLELTKVMSCVTGTSIGRRYARTDELGIPFAITVDSATSVTIRERDSKDQIRVNVDKAASVVKDLTAGVTTWAQVWSSFPHHPIDCDSIHI